jgi:hypothetical protein
VYRPEFEAALKLLGRAFEAVARQGFDRPILVGGAAVEFYTSGAVTSGDFDVVTLSDEPLQRALEAEGFLRENRQGYLQRGYYHPHLAIGVEIVSGQLFDGHADKTKLTLVDLGDGSRVSIVAVEDIIADRMGQFASTAQGVSEMLDQAVKLFLLAGEIDETYIERRIKEETMNAYSLAFLKAKVLERCEP